MKKIVLFLCICFFSCAASAELFLVQNVSVSAMADSGVKAKEAALLQGAQQAFSDLLKKVALVQNSEDLPLLAPEDVANFVQDVVINDEQTTALKYTGSLNFRFNEKAVKTFLKGQNIPFLTQEPPRFVIVPIWQEGGQVYTLSSDNPLYDAVGQLNQSDRLFQFLVPATTVSEQALINPAVLTGADLSGLEPLLRSYPVDHVLWVFVERQGDIYRLQARAYPFDLGAGSRVDFMASAHAADQKLVASKLLEKMADELESGWRTLQMENQGNESTFEIRVPVANLTEWIQIRQKLNAINGIEKYTIQSVNRQQLVLLISSNQPRAQLARQFEQKDLFLMPDETGGWVLFSENVFKAPETVVQQL